MRRGNRGKAELVYNSNNNAPFSVPGSLEKVRMSTSVAYR